MAFLCCWSYAQTVRYVKQGGTGNGSSWSSASGDIQAMINASSVGDEVRVAAGTYKPNRLMTNTGTVYTGTNAAELRRRSFVLKAGVLLKGGYPANAATGNENWRPLENKTILSGDFGNNDNFNATTLITTNNGENAISVVGISGSANQHFSMEGFHITGGNANTPGSATVNGNTLFTDDGGGVSITGSGMNATTPGIANLDHPTVSIKSCVFYRNSATRVAAIRARSRAVLTAENNLFYENRASLGGAIAANQYHTYINRNTFYKNAATSAGGAIWAERIPSVDTNILHISIHSNIFDNNLQGSSTTVEGANMHLTGPTTDTWLRYMWFAANCVQNEDTHYSATDGSSSFGINFEADPKFVNPSAYDFRLKYHSSLIELFGGNPGNAEKDLAGNPRFVGDADFGALEYILIPNQDGVIHVRKGGSGNGTGSSWDNAVEELAAVLEYKSSVDEGSDSGIEKIWISAGTYKPQFGLVAPHPQYPNDPNQNIPGYDPQHPYATFELSKDMKIYGGFPATGSPTLNERNWKINKTVLSGDLNDDDMVSGFGNTLEFSNRSDNSRHVLYAYTVRGFGDIVLDGLVVKGGHAAGTDYHQNASGGGFFLVQSSYLNHTHPLP